MQAVSMGINVILFMLFCVQFMVLILLFLSTDGCVYPM
jgi:hypothetical protein